jgi:hypothetical protein
VGKWAIGGLVGWAFGKAAGETAEAATKGLAKVADDVADDAIRMGDDLADDASRIVDDVADDAARGAGGGGIRWGFWDDLDKVTIGGREYASIGGRPYTRHAVERMTPRGFGTAAGTNGVAGRGVPPGVVEDVLQNGAQTGTRVVDGATRVSRTVDNVTVVTEGDIVITVITR